MTRDYIATVLDADGALEETLHKVAPRAKDADYQAEPHPLPLIEDMGFCSLIDIPPYQVGDNQHEHAATNASLPGFAWADAWKELVLSQQGSSTIGSCIVGPKEHEDAQGQKHIDREHSLWSGLKSQYVDHREREGNIHLSEHRVSPTMERILILEIEFGDEQIERM